LLENYALHSQLLKRKRQSNDIRIIQVTFNN
jgi:hypothetical protein